MSGPPWLHYSSWGWARSTGSQARPPMALLPSAGKPRLWFICVVSAPSVKRHCFLLTSDEKHIHAQTTKARQEFIWFLLLGIGLPLNNRKTDPNQTFPLAQRCSERHMLARPHATVRYQRQNKLNARSWFKPVPSCKEEWDWISSLCSAAKCVLWNYGSLKAPAFYWWHYVQKIGRRGCDLSMSQGSFYSNVQILVCPYFS